jgi:hypothetical protein
LKDFFSNNFKKTGALPETLPGFQKKFKNIFPPSVSMYADANHRSVLLAAVASHQI